MVSKGGHGHGVIGFQDERLILCLTQCPSKATLVISELTWPRIVNQCQLLKSVAAFPIGADIERAALQRDLSSIVGLVAFAIDSIGADDSSSLISKSSRNAHLDILWSLGRPLQFSFGQHVLGHPFL